MSRLAGFALAVVAVMILASAASAQIGVDVGLHGGYAMYAAGESNGGMDFGLNVNTSFMPMLSGQVFADYFFYTETHDSTAAEPWQMETKMTDIPIGVHILYNIDIPGSPIKPYIGAGASFHLMSWTATTTVGGTEVEVDDSSSKLGIGGVGGVEFMASPQLGIFLELRDHYILTSEDIEGTDESTDNTNALYILAGVNYHFM